jgi:hypothetical protein
LATLQCLRLLRLLRLLPLTKSQIYLPLLWDAAECCAWPLPLSFHQGHFCGLALLHSHSKLDGTP